MSHHNSIFDRATDPLQYDHGEVTWSHEGHGLSPIRRVFLEAVTPYLEDVAGRNVLELGCGQGWLCAEIAKRGGLVLGIDPSARNIAAASEQHSDLRFQQSDLSNLKTTTPYDLITALMVFEHFPDLADSYYKVSSLLKPHGRLIMITGDFDKFTHPRFGYEVKTEEIAPGEVATRTDYGDRAGVIYDINRTVGRFVEVAKQTGFALIKHQPIPAPAWLTDEQPKYAEHNGAPLFHLLEFLLKHS